LNWDREAPLVVKEVEAVPSGPTKLKGPLGLLLPATWKLTAVFAGVVAFHDKDVQLVTNSGAGFPSFTEDTRLPDDEKPVFIYVLKPASVVEPEVRRAVHVPPLSVEVTRWPPA